MLFSIRSSYYAYDYYDIVSSAQKVWDKVTYLAVGFLFLLKNFCFCSGDFVYAGNMIQG